MAASIDGSSANSQPSDQASQVVHRLLHTMDDPIFAYEPDGTLVYVNRAYDELFCAAHPAGTLGLNIVDLEPTKRELIEKMLATNLGRRPGDPPLVIESPSTGPDGRPRWYEWRNVQKFDDAGNVTMVIGISRDTTRQRLAELQARRAMELLEESNRDLLEFAQVASHDLQEPLRKVSAFSDRLERRLGDTIDEQSLDYLGRMNGAVRRMQGLIDDLLTFARVNTRAAPMQNEALADIVDAVLSDLEIAIDESEAEVRVGTLPELPVDASQIGQLFQNLIGNALKFRRSGVPPKVTISATHIPGRGNGSDDPPGGWYEITVEDNGIGFDEQYASKIFAPFQRLHGRSEYNGSGVGLSVCRRIVERHRGDISAHATEGSGSTFSVRLPTSHVGEGSLGGDSGAEIDGLGIEHSIIDARAA